VGLWAHESIRENMKILELLTLLAVSLIRHLDNLRAHVTKFMVGFLLPMGHHRREFGLSDLVVLGVRRGPPSSVCGRVLMAEFLPISKFAR
jgi:hypothetical protein